MDLFVHFTKGAAWNLFLAGVPVGLGWSLAALARDRSEWRRRWWLAALVAAAWLAFLPNTSYLLTGWRHFFSLVEQQNLFPAAHESRTAMLEFLLVAAAFLVYTSLGVVTFTLAVRPLEHVARERGWPLRLLAPPFFLAIAHGVYLGLVLRFNSWDLVTRPGVVLQASLGSLTNPLLGALTLGFASAVWLAYLLMDIWLDGLGMRWARWTSTPPETGTAADARARA